MQGVVEAPGSPAVSALWPGAAKTFCLENLLDGKVLPWPGTVAKAGRPCAPQRPCFVCSTITYTAVNGYRRRAEHLPVHGHGDFAGVALGKAEIHQFRV